MKELLVRLKWFSIWLCLLMFLVSCAINPVTGEREFMVVREIAIGQEAAPSLNWGFGGRYRDPAES